MADTVDEDDDLKLVTASANLLDNLEASLPKLLWKPSKIDATHGRVHRVVKRRDLDYVIKLIEPFQGEPQLLDARLKHILPDIVTAYLEYLQLPVITVSEEHIDLQTAICSIIYTFAKVRGQKVIVGFFNNEPRYLELVLRTLEGTVVDSGESVSEWQVPYVLSLWLSHLLLAPFDLATISTTSATPENDGLELPNDLPNVAIRILKVALHYLRSPTKTQDATAAMLVRLLARPDMQKLRLADSLVNHFTKILSHEPSEVPITIYQQLGPLRFLAGVSSSADLDHLASIIYRPCQSLADSELRNALSANAVAKKLFVKVFRNIAILSVRSTSTSGPLQSFLETTSVLEDVIDFLLRSLGDRDTPVRYAAAKAISLIVLEVEPAMGHEVVQAVLDTFKEDMSRHSSTVDYTTANPLRWHGLTLTLGHTLFKRSAAPEQLPDILDALISALNFEQRTATGSSIGANVRDAANFGIWSVSRRYTTDELKSVDASTLRFISNSDGSVSIIQSLAVQLILSACLDPAGNIRRGSSAALQELVGRHPDQVHEGISLVQIVDYLAVGLRRRAIVDVACSAAKLHDQYAEALADALLGWRGVGSPDVSSREAAASALANLGLFESRTTSSAVADKIAAAISKTPRSDVETLHGLVLSLARMAEHSITGSARSDNDTYDTSHGVEPFWHPIRSAQVLKLDFTPRTLRSELHSAIARLAAAICRTCTTRNATDVSLVELAEEVDEFAERLLARHEDTILAVVPSLVRVLLALKRKAGALLGSIAAQSLSKRAATDASKSTVNGAGRAITLGALAARYDGGLRGEKARSVISTLSGMVNSVNVHWRIICIKALHLAVDDLNGDDLIDQGIAKEVCSAVHLGLNDYTIDERGDIGSLVRLQTIACTTSLFAIRAFQSRPEFMHDLRADIMRLSLEKLDRVRLQAAQCRRQHLSLNLPVTDAASVCSEDYFHEALRASSEIDAPDWKQRALLEGCISCAGISSDEVLQASRIALLDCLMAASTDHLHRVMDCFSTILKEIVEAGSASVHAALELLAFLLDTQTIGRLANTEFRWRSLLSTVQKSHHKSNDMLKILAAVHVYRGMADVSSIRSEVLKKLISMLKTNPYPRIRAAVAETLFLVTKEESLKSRNWTRPVTQNADLTKDLQQQFVDW